MESVVLSPNDTRVTKHQDVPRLSRETWVRHLNRSQSNLLQAAAIPMPWKIFGPHAGQLPAVDCLIDPWHSPLPSEYQ